MEEPPQQGALPLTERSLRIKQSQEDYLLGRRPDLLSEERKLLQKRQDSVNRVNRWLSCEEPFEDSVTDHDLEEDDSDTATILWVRSKGNNWLLSKVQPPRTRQLSPAALAWRAERDWFGIRQLEPIEHHQLARGKAILYPRPEYLAPILGFARGGKVFSPEPLIALDMTATTPARSGVSPSSSPRLPSPPPMAEIQYGPQSPSVGAVSNELQLDVPTKPDESAARRVRPGTKAADMATGPPLVPLQQLDSPFQLQEHLKALYTTLTHTQDSTRTVPITRETAYQIARPPQISETETVDKNLWLYELCRFLVLKANLVSVSLMADMPPCSALTCPEMRASEWQYLCAVHEPPKSCCAIDYCNHTLDWAANVLTSPKHFPSRLQLGNDSGNVFQSMRQLTNIFRRVYRIFAHAWFQHRDIFWNVEAVYGIYIFFKTVCDEYQLIPDDNYTIPPEAEGSRQAEDEKDPALDFGSRMTILRKENEQSPHENGHKSGDAQATTTTSTAATARRHKHTPSTGSHVTTIAEGQEDDEEASATAQLSGSSPPKPKNPSPDRAFPQSLGRLDIGGIVPAYVPRAAEDPTPIAQTRDPMAAAGRRNSGFESEVRSPGGGSVRTGGSDVLNAILGHMEEYDYPSSSLDQDVDHEDTAIALEEDVDEDENETMERIEIASPEVPARSPEVKQEDPEVETSGVNDEKDADADEKKTEEAERDNDKAEEEKGDMKSTSEDESFATAAEDLSTEQKEAPAGVA